MKDYGTQKAMASIVEYVYSVKMNFGNLDFNTLLEVLNISKMMLMKTDKLSSKIEEYINENVSKRVFCTIGQLYRGFILVERYCLENIRNSVAQDVFYCIRSVERFARSTKKVLQQFSVKLIKEILFYHENQEEDYEGEVLLPTTRQKFDFFMIWYSHNKDCDASNMKIILDSFKLEFFSGKELLTVVKQSGLFSEEDINKECIEKFEKLE